MLPLDRLSSLPVPANYLTPDSERITALTDYERGGIALNDPSQGLQVQDWEFYYSEARIMVRPVGGTGTIVEARDRVSELSGTFDQNMRPVVTYVVDGVIYLNWFDTVSNERRTDSFGAGYSPRVCLDDKRDSQFANSDVVFAYIRSQSLYYRQQRDRFATERLIKADLSPITRLKNVGMAHNLRLLFELV